MSFAYNKLPLFWQVNILWNHHLYQDVEHCPIKFPQWHLAVNPTVDNPWSELCRFMSVLPAIRFHTNGIVRQVLFRVCLLSLSIIFLDDPYYFMYSFLFVLLLSIILLYEYTTLCFSFTCVDTGVFYNFCLWWLKPLWMSVSKCFSRHVFILKEWETNTCKCNC